MPTRLAHVLTWLVSAVMTAVAVLPPVRIGCECAGFEPTPIASSTGCTGHTLSSCCPPEAPATDTATDPAEQPGEKPVPPCDHECPCEPGCCLMGRPVLVDASSHAKDEPAARAAGVAMAGPQTSAAGVHVGKLLRPPRG